MTKERFDQLANAAERMANIQDQQEQSDRQQRRDWEEQIYKEADEENRKLLDKDFVESLNPLAQENLKMRDRIIQLNGLVIRLQAREAKVCEQNEQLKEAVRVMREELYGNNYSKEFKDKLDRWYGIASKMI